MSEGDLPPATPPGEEIPEAVHVTSYPKIIFLWPTWALAFIIWLLSILNVIDLGSTNWAGWLWFGIFAFNIFIVAFEFSSAKFFLLVVVIAGIIIALFVLPEMGLLPGISAPELLIPEFFYLCYTVLFSLTYLFLWISRRFNYLEVSTQQISYHVGIMADERRYPAPSVRFEKRTTDIFERIMPPFCAKLVMKQEGGEEAEILNCVPRINKRLDQIKRILEHLRVKTY